VVVGVDPSATSTGDEAGIVVAGTGKGEGFVLADESLQGSPLVWAKAAVTAYHKHRADRIIAEANQGGEMVELTIRQVDPSVPLKLVHASRGKQTRAEPISAQYEKGLVHHVGNFPALEDEMCLWIPGDASPNRMDALVWALTELMLPANLGMLDFMAGQHAELKAKQKEEEKKSYSIYG
jgi:phage terminase large subunit-like protein